MEKIVPSVVLVGVMRDLQLEGIRLRLKVILLEVSMKNYRTVAIVWVLACLLAIPARAQVIPGRWEKVEALKLGSQITMDLKSGDRIEGNFEGLSPSELSLRTGSAQAAIPRSEIQKITARQHDRRWNTTLIGAGIGAGIGFGTVVARAGGWEKGEEFAAYGWGLSLLGAGIGALVAYTGDALIMEEVVLYQAP